MGLWALIAAALLPTRTLDSSWFAELEAYQDADYVLATRGGATPGRVAVYLITQFAISQGLTAGLTARIKTNRTTNTHLRGYAEYSNKATWQVLRMR